VISIVLSLTLIPKFGVLGAAGVMIINRMANVLLSIYIVGPKLVFEDNVWPILRVLAAGALMGAAVWLAQGIPFIQSLDEIIALVSLIGVGIVSYILLVFILRAVTPGEASFFLNVIRRRFLRKV
jgi:peptidoglycan biosynthesis protein MviN/MurJ (putative lipid II flippase)